MPTYEYRCDSCGQEFELIQRITDPPAETCSRCGGSVQRLIGATNFILKGNGWHKTDYAASPASDSASESKAPACGADKSKPQCGTCPANTD